jgi:hypothetical protein
MSVHSDEQIRSRLRRSFAEPPLLEGARPLLVLWRFPHLEPLNQSWTFLTYSQSPRAVLRLATWDRFEELEANSVAPIQPEDVELSPEELLEAFVTFANLAIRGDQTGGIYDGAWYGCDVYNEHSGEHTDSKEWIHGDTFHSVEDLLPESLRQKMRWNLIPYQSDMMTRPR